MRLTVLGCSGTFPGPDSPCSSYVVEQDGFRLLVDMGNGSSGILQRCLSLDQVDAVMVSHLHGDHYLDLVTYAYARRYYPAGELPQLPVYGPRGTAVQVARAFSKPVDDLLGAVYDFREVDSGPLEIGPFRLRLAPTRHPVETYAMRVEAGGRSLAYSADSGPCDELVDVAKDADLFLCEASYLDGDENPPDIHMTGKQAGEHSTRADARRLLLTHLVPWGDPARTLGEAYDAFAGDIALAATCQSYDV